MTQKISEGRQAAYYIGMALMVIGGLMFVSVFFTVFSNFGGDANRFHSSAEVDLHLPPGIEIQGFHKRSDFDPIASAMVFRGVGGMLLIVLGGIIQGIGAKGLAGSGVILNPEEARQDLEPYSRMAGGMLKDALDEADVHLGEKGEANEKIVMIRCLSCGTLNQEDSKFCRECGKKI
jgi:hypothetical protein